MKVNHHDPAAPSRPALTEAALCAWVGQAYPGEELIYHRGFLAIDTGPESTALTPADKRDLRAVAHRAFQLFQQGLVHLVQRREELGEYSYIVVARSRPMPQAATGTLRDVLTQAGLIPTEQPARRRA